MTFTKSGNTISSAIGEGLHNSNPTRSDYRLHAQIAARMNDDQNLRVSCPWFHTLAFCDTESLFQHQDINPHDPSLRYVLVVLTLIAVQSLVI